MLSAPTRTAPAASMRSISVASRVAAGRSRLIFDPARVDSPAGLDIGARTAAEIALSILAEVVKVRRRRVEPVAPKAPAGDLLNVIAPGDAGGDTATGESGLPDGAGGEMRAGAGGPAIVVDPICGMTVVVVPGTPSAQAGGETAYFCCEACKLAFERQQQAA